MKIGIIAPPFIAVPPRRYGGTELFIAHLAEGLSRLGHCPVVYTIGDSGVACETRWRTQSGTWPIQSALESSLDDLEHTSWACREAARECDLVHFNNAPGLNFTRFLDLPAVYTIHHPREAALSRFYRQFPATQFVAISHSQAAAEGMDRIAVIPHGLKLDDYHLADGKRDYLCFLGRIAPIKGTHIAIAVARRAGMRLKIAGEIQPDFRSYWEREIQPHVDGREVEYVGEVNLAAKNQLLAGARALLFPIDWEEPFGLVMIEAMACGAPVLAFARGSAPEVVRDGISGFLCRDVAEMAARARDLNLPPQGCRQYVADNFSLMRMANQYLALYQQLASPTLCARIGVRHPERPSPAVSAPAVGAA